MDRKFLGIRRNSARPGELHGPEPGRSEPRVEIQVEIHSFITKHSSKGQVSVLLSWWPCCAALGVTALSVSHVYSFLPSV